MRRQSKQVKIEDIAYHRNGVSGRGFYAVAFTCPDNGPMVGVVFPSGETAEGISEFTPSDAGVECAVLQRELLAEGIVAFGVNSWRGDCYAKALVQGIKAKSLLDSKHDETVGYGYEVCR